MLGVFVMSISNFYELLPKDNQAKQLVILLHGVGSNGQDLISLAPMFAQSLPHAAFISPDAPFVCDMVPPGYPNSYQWFSLQNRDPQIMLAGVKKVFPLVEEFIATQAERFGVSYDKIALIGFSQGTMTSLHVAPRLSQKIAGVLGYSGALIWDETQKDSLKQIMPLHLIHGEADDVVPVQAREMAEDMLEANGFEVTGHTTPGLTHSIDEKGIQSGTVFLKTIFGA